MCNPKKLHSFGGAPSSSFWLIKHKVNPLVAPPKLYFGGSNIYAFGGATNGSKCWIKHEANLQCKYYKYMLKGALHK
jgi:hypothetical protein